MRAHLVEQLVHDLAVEELERPLASLDERHRDTERGEDRGVLDPDHARAHDRQGPGKLLEPHEVARDRSDRRRPDSPPQDPPDARVIVLIVPEGTRVPKDIDTQAYRVFIRFAKR